MKCNRRVWPPKIRPQNRRSSTAALQRWATAPGYKLFLTEETEWPKSPSAHLVWHRPFSSKEYIKELQAFAAEQPKCTCGNSKVYYGGDGYCPDCPEGTLSSVTATDLVTCVTSLYVECSQCGWRSMAGTY